MSEIPWQYVIWASSLGGLSAVSLPLGSVVGLSTSPRPQIISAMAAFGAGALIAALSVELVAPTVAALEGGSAHFSSARGHGDPIGSFQALLIGLAIGGLAFVILDQLVALFFRHLSDSRLAASYGRCCLWLVVIMETVTAKPKTF